MIDLLFKRRSIRRYKNIKIEPEKIDLLVRAAMLAPSSRGLKPCELILVDQPELLAKLALAKKGAGHLKGAALGFVIIVNPDISDVWVEDASIVATILHLTAESLGLGSCWIQIRERMFSETETAEQFVRQVLAIPENLRVVAILSVGYPDETKSPYNPTDVKPNKVFLNSYDIN